uniref:C2H2-type domain-containing protein n=2 Tax=Trichogramma kaykai TaxID=54128 RepID=A0ABD2WV07_9HYME
MSTAYRKTYSGEQMLGYTCTKCSKFYKMWSNYLKHKCEAPEFKCLMYHQFYMQITNDMLPVYKPVPERNYFCGQCGRGYTRNENLLRHQRLECGQSPTYFCDLCDKRFFRRYELTKHKRLKHHV